MNTPYHVPGSWVQLANPSPWEGIHVNRIVADSHEGAFTSPTIIVSLIKKAADRYRSRSQSGRWTETEISSGSVCFVPCGWTGQTAWEGTNEAINVNIDLSWLRAGEDTRTKLRVHDQPLYGLNDKVAAAIIGEIYRDTQLGAPVGVAYTETLSISLLTYLTGTAMLQPPCRRNGDKAVVERALDYIHANQENRLTLSDIAHAAGFQRTLPAFCRLFKRHVGKTLHQYIHGVRMNSAKDLIARGGKSVTDVAMSCGFNNLSHFSDAFRQYWGVAPSVLLKQQHNR